MNDLRVLFVFVPCPLAEGQSICDTVICGKGTCREVPGLVIPPYNTSYNCICDPGSTQLLGIPFLPCTSPECK